MRITRTVSAQCQKRQDIRCDPSTVFPFSPANQNIVAKTDTMKKSRNVVLTLLVPAMAAFGCSQQTHESTPSLGGGSFSDAPATLVDGQTSKNSEDRETKQATNSASPAPATVHRGGGLHFIPIPWGGSRRSASPMPSQMTPSPRPSTAPANSGNGIVHGGFGNTGVHLSGGS